MEESASSAFKEIVGALYFGGGCDDIGLVVVYPLEALDPHVSSIKVSVEFLGKSFYVSVELGEGVDDIVWFGGLETVKQSMSVGNVNWEEYVAVSPHVGSVAIEYVHMEFV